MNACTKLPSSIDYSCCGTEFKNKTHKNQSVQKNKEDFITRYKKGKKPQGKFTRMKK